MPFTLSHAAAALPFRRFEPVWPALVIGTFAPDLQYFVLISDEEPQRTPLPRCPAGHYSLCAAGAVGIRECVKGPTIELLPSGWQRRLQDKLKPLSFWGLKQFGLILLWIVLGVATHLLWDQFTHAHSGLAGQWMLLRTMVRPPLFHSISVARLLQHLSTVGGIAILAVWLAAWYRRTPPSNRSQPKALSPGLKAGIVLTMSTIALAAGYPLAMWRLTQHPAPIIPSAIVGTTFVASTMVLCIQLLLYGLAITVSTRSRRATATQSD